MREKPMKVLVTDQDSEFLRIADEKLSGRGFKVIMSRSAVETIEYLKVINVDYIMVSNIRDRLKIAEFIKSLSKKPHLFDEFTFDYQTEETLKKVPGDLSLLAEYKFPVQLP